MAVFADLPPEVVAEILWRLPLRDRFTAVELTCKQWLASSRRREAFQTVDLGLWRTTEGAAIASNQMLEHIVVASLGSMFHAKRGGEAYQLQPSPICRICLDKLSHLTIKDCSLTRPEVQQLITAAAANGKLTSLTLSREQLGPQGAVDIANMLAQTALRCLRVELCDVDSQGLAALAAAVARSTTLELLSLSGNVSPPWDDVALKLLAQAVEQSPSLQHLSMPELAPAATAGAQWLVQALRQQRFTKRSETSMLGYSTFHTSAVYSKARGRVVY
ncbi:hypothetical protein WJX72_000120 [[Myrmecia] bisecta]|uniref:F-box domain-containing protein n=1 Tax=[Myrmecia] bisecta TaxID=41462 RepID=A0AAW1P6T8_9CHLO